jgi:hypothetical protein
VNEKSNVLIFGNGIVHITDFADDIRKRNFAEARQPLALLDFGKPHNGGDDRERLIYSSYRVLLNRLQFLQRAGPGAAVFERQPRPGERRSQIMRDGALTLRQRTKAAIATKRKRQAFNGYIYSGTEKMVPGNRPGGTPAATAK